MGGLNVRREFYWRLWAAGNTLHTENVVVQQAELSMISDATVTDVAGEILLETLLEIPSGSADTFLSRIIYNRVIVQEKIATLHRVCAHPL